MKDFHKSISLVMISLLGISECHSQEIPQVHVSNGIIDCDIYLPDAKIGYYRGTRFDWAGVIPNLEYKGHTYFGKWFKKYGPTIHDAIMGPVEAFDPIGYDGARPGDGFVKIGVGILQRPDTTGYHFAKPYKIMDNGTWKVKTKKDEVGFTHRIAAGKYPYTYKKVVRLKGNKLIIEHRLDNDGDNTIETKVFDHNFFVMDNQNIGPDFIVGFPFTIEGDVSRLGDRAKIVNGNEIGFVEELGEKDHPFIAKLSGFGPTNSDYDITVENTNSGAGARITCDRPLSNVVFWSAIKTMSPEPYIDVNVRSSESFSWTITYEFYTF